MALRNAQVAHEWAHHFGGNFSGSNMFTDGEGAIYSYGHHWKLGQRYKGAFFLNEDRYSNTTARHQSYVSYAVPLGVPRFYVPHSILRGHPGEQFLLEAYDHYMDEARNALIRMEKSEFPDKSTPTAAHRYRAAAREARFYQEKARELYQMLDDETQQRRTHDPYPLEIYTKWEVDASRVESQKAERAAIDREEQMQRAEVNFRTFKRRQTAHFPQLLRVNKDANRIETSGDAQITVVNARTIWKMIRLVTGGTKSNIHRLKPLTEQRPLEIDNFGDGKFIDEKGTLQVGCHRILFEELEHIAAELQLPPLE